MKIDIWSDIACPFCYIGKYHLEQALKEFDHADEVKIKWHSFELDPEAEIDPDQDIYEMLASKYGQSLEWAKQANEDMKEKAAEAGIEFNPKKIQPTNTFDAHRLIKLADKHGLANYAEERLFSAYFSEGLHVAKPDTLKQVGKEIGLDEAELDDLLSGESFADGVRADEKQAQEIGIRGVPFFIFNQKFAVTGAQPVHTFKEALERCYQDEQENAVDA